MQTRYKILILLLTVAIGALALWHFVGDHEAMVRFRSLFYGSSFSNLKPNVISASDPARLWYSAVALFAVVVIALTFRAGRRNGPGTRARLIELKPTKVQTGKLFQGSSWYDRFKGHVKDVGFERKLRGLEKELREKDELLQRQSEELDWLRSKVMIRPNPSSRETQLQQELDQLTERLQVNASATTELEGRLTATEDLLQTRSEEVNTLKEEAIRLTQQLDELRVAKEQGEDFPQRQLNRTESLQAQDSLATEVDALNSEVVHLRKQLDDLRLAKKQTEDVLQRELNRTESLQVNDSLATEADALNSEVVHLRQQLDDLRLAKEEAEDVWQQELQTAKSLQESVMAAQENGLNEKVQALESALTEKEGLLQDRDKELKATKAKVSSLRERLAAAASTKKQFENALQQQLRKKTELLESKEAALKESQDSAATKLEDLESELREREKLLQDRGAAVEALESEVTRLNDATADNERAKSLLMQELQNRTELLQAKDARVMELEDRLNITLQALENAQRDVERLTRKSESGAEVKEQPGKSAPPKSRPYRKGLNSTLFELGAAKERATASQQAEEARRTSEADSTRKQARQISRRDQEPRRRKRT